MGIPAPERYGHSAAKRSAPHEQVCDASSDWKRRRGFPDKHVLSLSSVSESVHSRLYLPIYCKSAHSTLSEINNDVSVGVGVILVVVTQLFVCSWR